jgi:hypothetical protein
MGIIASSCCSYQAFKHSLLTSGSTRGERTSPLSGQLIVGPEDCGFQVGVKLSHTPVARVSLYVPTYAAGYADTVAILLGARHSVYGIVYPIDQPVVLRRCNSY